MEVVPEVVILKKWCDPALWPVTPLKWPVGSPLLLLWLLQRSGHDGKCIKPKASILRLPALALFPRQRRESKPVGRNNAEADGRETDLIWGQGWTRWQRKWRDLYIVCVHQKLSAGVSAALTHGTDLDMERTTTVPFLPYKETWTLFVPCTDGSSVFFSCVLSSRTLTTESLDCPQPHVPNRLRKLAHISISVNEWFDLRWRLLLGLEAPYVSLSQLSFSVPVSPNKQSHCPLPPYAVLWPLTFFFWLDLHSRSELVAAFLRFCNSQWWKNVKQGIRKNTLSIWAKMALRLKWAVLEMNIPRTRKKKLEAAKTAKRQIEYGRGAC